MVNSYTVKSMLMGLAIGDALGVPVEFVPRYMLQANPVVGMRSGGSWNQPAGTWSDDTSMTLATMASITRCGEIDYDDIMNRFIAWYKHDSYTVDGLFDIGTTTRLAILHAMDGHPALECGITDVHNNGNGSLMRILPIAVYLYSQYGTDFDDEVMDVIHNVSALTHGHEISQMCCGLYCLIAAELLDGSTIQEAIELGLRKGETYYSMSEYADEFKRLFSGRIGEYEMSDISSSGYVVHTLEAVIWSLLHSEDYASAVLTAVNLGDDTDTVAAITGGLAGIAYGMDYIPIEWLYELRASVMLDVIADRFSEVLRG